MFIRKITSPAELKEYDEWVRHHPHGSLWQSAAWGSYQRTLGREVRIYENGKCKMENGKLKASALVVIDRTAGGYSTWEITRGPLWTSEEAVGDLVRQIIADAKQDRCIQLSVSPTLHFQFSIFNFQLSRRHVHPEATRIIDLTLSDEQILATMHPKGRYNIGVAGKHGITVRTGSPTDIDAFYDLLQSTGGRDGFKISQKSHYTRFLTALDQSFLLLAEQQGKPVAGLISVMWNGTGIYYYGASSYEHRNLMAPYLLQWEAMKRCKAAGCTRYDLLGISPENAPANDPWQGITEFKRKFGGTVVTYPHERMIVLRPLVKLGLDLKRKLIG